MKKLIFFFFLFSTSAWGQSETITIDAQGVYDQWCLGAGASKPVAMQSDDGNTSYIFQDDGTLCVPGGVGTKESYTLTDIAADGPIDSVVVFGKAAKNGAAGAVTIRLGVYSNAVAKFGGNIALTTTYTLYSAVFATDPATGVAWTKDAVNALQWADTAVTITAPREARVSYGYVTVYFNPAGQGGTQVPTPCNTTTGDTLYPVGTGAANALSNGCGGVQANNYLCVNETPTSSGCEAGDDSVWTNSTTQQVDYYKLGINTADVSKRWGKRGTASRIIDCIAVSACVRKTQGSSFNMEVRLALRDTSGNVCWGPLLVTNSTSWQTVTAYFPDTLIGAIWGSTRWDSLAMLGLQVGLGMRVSNAGRNATCRNIYAIVYARNRDTTLADSTVADMQVMACTTGVGLFEHRPSGMYVSSRNPNRSWLAVNSTTNWFVSASNDTGKTWYWIDSAATGNNTDNYDQNRPDTVSIRSASDNLGSSSIMVFGDSSVATDSFHIGSYENATLDSAIIYLTKQRQQTLGELTARTDQNNGPLVGTVALIFPAFYQLADTIWMVGGTNTTTGRLRWARSVNNGQTWPDSGYIQGPGCVCAQDTGTINTTSANRRVIFVRWAKGYPAVVITGWAGTGHTSKTTFLRWHPAVTNADSMRNHAWWRADGTCTVESVTVANLTPDNSGEMVATSVYTTSAGADTMAHIFWFTIPRIYHATVKPGPTVKIDTVADITANGSGQVYLAATSLKMKDVYVFWNYYKTNSNTDTTFIFYSRLCPSNDNRFDGPRPLSFLEGVNVRFNLPATAPYQWGNAVLCAFPNRARAGAFTSVKVNRIVRAGSWGAAPPAGITPPRRKILIERKNRIGEQDEKDSLAVPAYSGIRLPFNEEK